MFASLKCLYLVKAFLLTALPRCSRSNRLLPLWMLPLS